MNGGPRAFEADGQTAPYGAGFVCGSAAPALAVHRLANC
jgi:hypothetical protein